VDHEITKANPEIFLDACRFDVPAKYIYAHALENNTNLDFAYNLYKDHIKVWNNCRHGDGKRGIQEYVDAFKSLLHSIKTEGFNPNKSLINVTKDLKLLNGGHRVAACLLYGKEVWYAVGAHQQAGSGSGQTDANYEYFKNKTNFVPGGLPEKWCDAIAVEYLRLKPNTFMVTISPKIISGHSEVEGVLKQRSKIFYKTTRGDAVVYVITTKNKEDIKYIEEDIHLHSSSVMFTALDQESKDRRTDEVLKVIKHITATDSPTDFTISHGNGKGYVSGYHSVKILNQKYVGQRNDDVRLELVPEKFKDKTVLDLGCNCGGTLQTIADDIKRGIGLDYDHRCINAANLISKTNGFKNLDYYVFNLQEDPFDLIDCFIQGDKVDWCFMLSISQWIRNWEEVLAYCARISDNLLYETNCDNRHQKQIDYLKTLYGEVTVVSTVSNDDPKWKNRTLIVCKNEIRMGK